MRRNLIPTVLHALAAVSLMAAPAASALAKKQPDKTVSDIPVCGKVIGTVAVLEPDTQWWREYELGSPELLIKYFVSKSKCFRLVDRSKGLAMRSVERAMADSGELRQGSKMGKGQVKAADFFLVPDLVGSNRNSGGTNVGAALGGLLGGGVVGGLLGGISLKKKEANVLLTVVDARSTEQVALAEGHYKKTDLGWGAGGGVFGGFGGAAGVSSYANTDIGKVITMAYLEAYFNLVNEMGGNPIVPNTTASDEPATGGARSSSASSTKTSSSKSSFADNGKSNVTVAPAAPSASYKTTQGMPMLKTASDKSPVVRQLPPGAVLKATGKKNGIYWEVQDRSGQTGWVMADFLDDAN
jgi:curli biogenesis system outer membrane secretion channel CsgG